MLSKQFRFAGHGTFPVRYDFIVYVGEHLILISPVHYSGVGYIEADPEARAFQAFPCGKAFLKIA